MSWDIYQLAYWWVSTHGSWMNSPPYHPPCTTPLGLGHTQCGYTVEVDGQCFYCGSADYVTLGVMWRLCSDDGQK